MKWSGDQQHRHDTQQECKGLDRSRQREEQEESEGARPEAEAVERVLYIKALATRYCSPHPPYFLYLFLFLLPKHQPHFSSPSSNLRSRAPAEMLDQHVEASHRRALPGTSATRGVKAVRRQRRWWPCHRPPPALLKVRCHISHSAETFASATGVCLLSTTSVSTTYPRHFLVCENVRACMRASEWDAQSETRQGPRRFQSSKMGARRSGSKRAGWRAAGSGSSSNLGRIS